MTVLKREIWKEETAKAIHVSRKHHSLHTRICLIEQFYKVKMAVGDIIFQTGKRIRTKHPLPACILVSFSTTFRIPVVLLVSEIGVSLQMAVSVIGAGRALSLSRRQVANAPVCILYAVNSRSSSSPGTCPLTHRERAKNLPSPNECM